MAWVAPWAQVVPWEQVEKQAGQVVGKWAEMEVVLAGRRIARVVGIRVVFVEVETRKINI